MAVAVMQKRWFGKILARCVAGATVVALGAEANAGGLLTFSRPVHRYRLTNGLTVVLAPDSSLDEVSVVVRYGVGSADDPAGKEGLAHLVEHLMFKGSRHVGPAEFTRRAARAGATNVGGRTKLDETTYFATLPEAGLPTLLWLESDRMGFFLDRLDQATLEAEKRIIADEVYDRVLDQNLGLVGPDAWMEIYPAWHPYRRDWRVSDLPSVTLDDVRAFWRTWYSPSNATVAIAGAFDESAVRVLVEQDFGDLPTAPVPDRPALSIPWRVHDVRVEAAANVPHDVVSFLWASAALDQPGDAELDLAAAILTDPDGRLQSELVGRGHAIQVTARESSFSRNSVFGLTAVLAEGVASDEVVAVIDRVVRELAAKVEPKEVERARDEWFRHLMLRLETSAGRAVRMAHAGAFQPWDLEKYQATGAVEIATAVRWNLIDDRRVVVVVHRNPHFAGQGVVLSRRALLP
jgi:zinc protease